MCGTCGTASMPAVADETDVPVGMVTPVLEGCTPDEDADGMPGADDRFADHGAGEESGETAIV